MRGGRSNSPASSSRLWSEILANLEMCERLERLWTASLRSLYPSVGLAELSGRFLEPWRQLVELQLPLEELGNVLRFEPADLPGWQSLGVAVAGVALANHNPRRVGLLSKELSRMLVEACSDQVPPGARALRLVSSTAKQPPDGGLPEAWTDAGGLVGSSPAIRALGKSCARAARDRYPVLLSGGTGCGKEVAARLIHQWSECGGRFVPVNCAALPESLIESELFGHARGAFTGATVEREGLIHAAREGTLFLDEISELPLLQQAKLLRVLQDGLVRPLGSVRHEHVDVRVISATNRDLEQILAQGLIRRDLYYRLAVHEIRVPSLSEHLEDIPELVASFLVRWRQTNPRLASPSFRPEALDLLRNARWPGNVRELENAVYRLASNHPGEAVGAAEVQELLERSEQQTRPDVSAGPMKLAALEQQAVEKALATTEGNKAGAARLLGITRKTLYHKIRHYRIALTKK